MPWVSAAGHDRAQRSKLRPDVLKGRLVVAGFIQAKTMRQQANTSKQKLKYIWGVRARKCSWQEVQSPGAERLSNAEE